MSKYQPEGFMSKRNKGLTVKNIVDAVNYGTILESLVTKCDNECNLTLNIGENIIGIINKENITVREMSDDSLKKDAACRVNKFVRYIPLSIHKEDNIYIVECSRKLAQETCLEKYIDKLWNYDVVDARIVGSTLSSYICDIGCGLTYLLPFKNVSMIKNNYKILEHRKNIHVIINRLENGDLLLSHKELMGTWNEEASKLNVDDIVTGVVMNKMDYGTFIAIGQNLVGLSEYNEEYNTGDLVNVIIKSIQPEKHKVRLSILGTAENINNTLTYYIDKDNLSNWSYYE